MAGQVTVPQAQQRPVFQASVAAVGVDVSVKLRNKPVLGLGAEDFQLTDNGVPQRIELVSLETIPLDVSILLDASASMYGVYAWLLSVEPWVKQTQAQVPSVTALLGPTDRFRVLSFGLEVRQVLAMQGPRLPLQLSSFPSASGTSLYDAVFLALLHDPGPDRRHLVVAFTDGDDTTSVVSADQLIDTAGRSEASVHIIYALARGRAPSDRPFAMFNRLADLSGGDVHTPIAGRLPAAFERVLADYRARYLLRYSPQGVVPGGWHQVDVRVRPLPKADVKARKGYFSRLSK